MEYLVAVSSSDGIVVNQHFGHTAEFQILRVEDNQRYLFIERREVTPPCHTGDHNDSQLAQTAAALSDCKYVLSAKIGQGAQAVLRDQGVTPLEIAHLIDYAMEKVMLYDQKFKHDRHERGKHYG